MAWKVDRRRFVIGGACGTVGAAMGIMLPSCGGAPVPVDHGAGKVPVSEGVLPGSVEGSETEFPFLRVSGSPREIGRGIGSVFGDFVKLGLQRRADWFAELKTFATGEGGPAYDKFLAAAGKHAPVALAELEGWAEGTGT